MQDNGEDHNRFVMLCRVSTDQLDIPRIVAIHREIPGDLPARPAIVGPTVDGATAIEDGFSCQRFDALVS